MILWFALWFLGGYALLRAAWAAARAALWTGALVLRLLVP